MPKASRGQNDRTSRFPSRIHPAGKFCLANAMRWAYEKSRRPRRTSMTIRLSLSSSASRSRRERKWKACWRPLSKRPRADLQQLEFFS